MQLLLLSLYTLVSSLYAFPSVPYGIIHPTQQSAERFGPGIFKNPIKYTMGSPVLTDNVNIYLIYYGNFELAQKSIIEDFLNGIDKTAWFAVNKKYYYQKDSESPKEYATGNVRVAGTVDVDYTKGKKLDGTALPELVQEAIDSGAVPEDTSAVYFILTAGDVKESIRPELGRASFCSSYCGYHVSWELKSGNRIFYSQVGVPTACMTSCGGKNHGASPNGDAPVDAMISVIAHELVEAISDPESDGKRAWSDFSGQENADKCAWTYGNMVIEDGYKYNMEFKNRKFLVQQNWDPETQSCSMIA